MDSWILWLIVTAAFTAGELHTNSFYLAPFAAGGAIATALAAAGAGGLVATVTFFAAGIVFLALLRPVAVRHRNSRPTLRTGSAALIGQPAMVLERIANREGVGAVKIGGEVWTARAYDDSEVFDAGDQVEVVEIRGATALVMH